MCWPHSTSDSRVHFSESRTSLSHSSVLTHTHTVRFPSPKERSRELQSKMRPTEFVSIVVLALAIYSPLQVFAHSAEPFAAALETLQNQIEYRFQNIGILRRAVTHASFSEENNKAFSILGASVIESSIALKSLTNNVDISPKDLNRQISEICNVETSCAKDGSKWGLEKVVRVSPKTDSSTPAVVCGAFRAVIGAVALDTESSEDAMRVFWKGHDGSGSRRANSK